MSHELFDLKKIHSVFIKVSAECMAECMTGDPPGPSKFFFMLMDMPAQIERIDRPVFTTLLRKQITPGSAAGKPVLCEDVQGEL